MMKSYELRILHAYSQHESEEKSIKIFRKSSRGHSQGLPKMFRTLIYRAHRAVIFAIAQLSCYFIYIILLYICDVLLCFFILIYIDCDVSAIGSCFTKDNLT